MFNSTIENRDLIIASVEEAIDSISDTSKLDDKISVIEKEKTLLYNKQKEARTALSILRENKEPLAEFDEALFFGLIENVVVKSKDILIFSFKDGTEIERKI